MDLEVTHSHTQVQARKHTHTLCLVHWSMSIFDVSCWPLFFVAPVTSALNCSSVHMPVPSRFFHLTDGPCNLHFFLSVAICFSSTSDTKQVPDLLVDISGNIQRHARVSRHLVPCTSVVSTSGSSVSGTHNHVPQEVCSSVHCQMFKIFSASPWLQDPVPIL